MLDERETAAFSEMHARASETLQLCSGMNREEFLQDRVRQLAVTRLIEIVGEASTRVSEDTKGRFPTLPWAEMRGMRNRLIHGYEDVDLSIVWETVTSEFPMLLDQLKEALSELGIPEER